MWLWSGRLGEGNGSAESYFWIDSVRGRCATPDLGRAHGGAREGHCCAQPRGQHRGLRGRGQHQAGGADHQRLSQGRWRLKIGPQKTSRNIRNIDCVHACWEITKLEREPWCYYKSTHAVGPQSGPHPAPSPPPPRQPAAPPWQGRGCPVAPPAPRGRALQPRLSRKRGPAEEDFPARMCAHALRRSAPMTRPRRWPPPPSPSLLPPT